jgi:Flp pilus assembly protein TadB
MLTVAVFGAVLGLGAWCVIAGLVRQPRPLAALAADLERDRGDAGLVDASTRWQRVAVAAAGRTSPRLASDLEVTERSASQHAIDRLSTVLLLAGLPLAAAIVAGLAGVGVPAVTAVVAMLAGGPVGWWVCDLSLARAAGQARREFRQALATYLDLVITLIVGGAGVETALADAAAVGSGPAFRQLRAALGAAQERRQPPWRALGRLGRRIGVSGLEELSAASVSDTLAVKADALRDRELDEERADAERSSEAMSLPVVAMGLAFVVMVMFPALVRLTQI